MFKYTLKNIMRVPIKSIAVFLIFTLVFSGILIVFSISSAATEEIKNTRISLGSRVDLQVDTEKYFNDYVAFQKGESKKMPVMLQLEWDMADKISNSEYVKEYNITIEGAGNANITPYTLETTEETPEGNPNFRLLGDMSAELNKDFYSGDKSLIKGRFYTQEEVDSHAKVAIIDQTLAKLNDLAVGDIIKFKSLEKVDMNFEVIGVYEDSVEDEGKIPYANMIRANCIYIPYTTAMDSRGDAQYKDLITQMGFYLKDPLKIDEFKRSLYNSNIALNGYKLNADDAAYEKMILGFAYTRSKARKAGWIIALIGLLALIVIVIVKSLAVKSHALKLKAMGMNNKTILKHKYSELLVIITVTFIISIIISIILTQPFATSVIRSTRPTVNKVITSAEQNAMKNAMAGGGILQAMNVDPVFNINAGLSYIVLIAGLLIVLILLAIHYMMVKKAVAKSNPILTLKKEAGDEL